MENIDHEALQAWIDRNGEQLAVTLTSGELDRLTTALALAEDAAHYLRTGERVGYMTDAYEERWTDNEHGLLDAEREDWEALRQRLQAILKRTLQSRRRLYRKAFGRD